MFYCQVVIDCLKEDQQTVDFCREFGQNAPAEMAWLMARILTTYISDKREIDRLAEEITATLQWKRFAERAASPAATSAYWQRLHAEQTRAAGVCLPVQTKAEETPTAVELVVAPSETVAAMSGGAELATRNSEASQAATPPEVSQAVESKQTRQSTKKPKRITNYRSLLRRTIRSAFLQNPEATDLEVIAFLDAEDALEVPRGLKTKDGEQTFGQVYRIKTKQKHRLEETISKVRRDMRRS